MLSPIRAYSNTKKFGIAYEMPMKKRKINVKKIIKSIIEDPDVLADLTLHELKAVVNKLELDDKIQDKRKKSEYIQVINEYLEDLEELVEDLEDKSKNKSFKDTLLYILQRLAEKYGEKAADFLITIVLAYIAGRGMKK